MKQTIVPMKLDARLVVRTNADLLIEGGDQPQLSATVKDGDSFRMRDEGGAIYIQANSDTKLKIPAGASLTLERVSGDVSIAGMTAPVSIQKVGGDLQFQKIASIMVDSVGGDCVFKDVEGSVTINRVGGDLDGHKVNEISAAGISGDVELSSVTGKVRITAGGDLRLQYADAKIPESHVRAGGDVELAVMENSQANLQLDSEGEEISVQACGQHLDVEEQGVTLPLGSGGEMVEVRTGGSISIREGKEAMGEFSFVFDDLEKNWRDFGKEIEDKIRRSMKGVNHELRRAGWEASGAMRRATDRMGEFAGSGGGGNESRVFGFGFDNAREKGTVTEKPPVSDEERMMILKMLQEKKITVEEAEKLLQALEG